MDLQTNRVLRKTSWCWTLRIVSGKRLPNSVSDDALLGGRLHHDHVIHHDRLVQSTPSTVRHNLPNQVAVVLISNQNHGFKTKSWILNVSQREMNSDFLWVLEMSLSGSTPLFTFIRALPINFQPWVRILKSEPPWFWFRLQPGYSQNPDYD